MHATTLGAISAAQQSELNATEAAIEELHAQAYTNLVSLADQGYDTTAFKTELDDIGAQVHVLRAAIQLLLPGVCGACSIVQVLRDAERPRWRSCVACCTWLRPPPVRVCSAHGFGSTVARRVGGDNGSTLHSKEDSHHPAEVRAGEEDSGLRFVRWQGSARANARQGLVRVQGQGQDRALVLPDQGSGEEGHGQAQKALPFASPYPAREARGVRPQQESFPVLSVALFLNTARIAKGE